MLVRRWTEGKLVEKADTRTYFGDPLAIWVISIQLFHLHVFTLLRIFELRWYAKK